MMNGLAVTGAGGRLGSCLVKLGAVPLNCDITDPASIQGEVDRLKPLTVINCAAYTAVDDCETNEGRRKAVAVNMRGPINLRRAFHGYLIHISTGFVFDGEAGPYAEDAEPNPVNFYGMSKFGGEAGLSIRDDLPTLIVRVLDLFGGPSGKIDFVQAVRRMLESGQSKALPSFLCGTPTYIPHLADALFDCVERGLMGTLHVGGSLNISRYEWGRMIARHFDHDPRLITGTKEITGAATRPLNATLDVSKARRLGLPIHSPSEGLKAIKGLEAASGH